MEVSVWGTGEYFARGTDYLKRFGHIIVDKANVLVCLAYGSILRRETLDRFKLGCINFHCGLPNYRGRHPLQWMLINGEPRIPCAVHYMDEGIDTGDIIVESSFPVDRNETYASALEKVLDSMGPLLIAALRYIEDGKVPRLKQPTGREWPRRMPMDSAFDFNRPSAAVHRFINAMSDPMPNANCNGVTYKHSYSGNEPGQTLAWTTDGRMIVATADGIVMVDAA